MCMMCVLEYTFVYVQVCECVCVFCVACACALSVFVSLYFLTVGLHVYGMCLHTRARACVRDAEDKWDGKGENRKAELMESGVSHTTKQHHSTPHH